MSIVLYHFVFRDKCDDSNEHILELLSCVPEAHGKPINGEVFRFNINGLQENVTDGKVYLINDQHITSEGVYIVFENLFLGNEQEFIPVKEIRSTATTETLAEVLSQFAGINENVITSSIWEGGTLCYHIKVDNASIREKLSTTARKLIQTVGTQRDFADLVSPDPMKLMEVYQLAAKASISFTFEYHDGPREFSFSFSSPVEAECFETDWGSFDIVAELAIEHLLKHQPNKEIN